MPYRQDCENEISHTANIKIDYKFHFLFSDMETYVTVKLRNKLFKTQL